MMYKYQLHSTKIIRKLCEVGTHYNDNVELACDSDNSSLVKQRNYDLYLLMLLFQ